MPGRRPRRAIFRATPEGWGAAGLLVVLTIAVAGLCLHACGVLFYRAPRPADRRRAPMVRPAPRPAITAEEVDFDDDEDMDVVAADGGAEQDDRPARLALLFGALTHAGLSIAGRARRFDPIAANKDDPARMQFFAIEDGCGPEKARCRVGRVRTDRQRQAE